jgi:alanine racemase
MSHLSDGTDATTTDTQIASFKTLYTRLTHAGHTPRYRHIGASTGIFTIRDPFFTARRRGKAMYGYTPDEHGNSSAATGLQPIATVRSTILNIRMVPAGQSVGYSGTRVAPRDSRIALIPRGYFEGLPR